MTGFARESIASSCIEIPGVGAGFFVSGQLALTARHNVPKVQKTIAVNAGATEGGADVVHGFSAEGQSLDIVLLKTTLCAPSVVHLGTSHQRGDACLAYGFTKDSPKGDPATLHIEGYTGDGLFKLKGGQIVPGFSGSPLLNLRNNTVIGVVVETRDRRLDLGGYAIPISAIREDLKRFGVECRALEDAGLSWDPTILRQLSKLDQAVRALESPDASRRKRAAQFLSTTKDIGSHSDKLLAALVVEREPGVARWLAFAVAQQRVPNSLQVLLDRQRHFSDVDAEAATWLKVAISLVLGQQRAFEELRALHGSHDAQATTELLAVSWAFPNVSSGLDIDLTTLLGSTHASARQWAALALGKQSSQPADARDALISALGDDAYRVREWAEWSLAQAPDIAAVRPLIARLSDPHPRVREWAAKSLAAIGTDDAANAILLHLSRETETMSREGAVRSLAPWVDRREVHDALLQILVGKSDATVATAAADVLIASSLAVRDPSVRTLIVDVLAASGTDEALADAATLVIDSLPPDEQKIVRALAEDPKMQILASIVDRMKGKK